jgi:hypothetical protein
MVASMKTVLMRLPSAARGKGPRMSLGPLPFHDYSPAALRLTRPFSIVARRTA